MARRRVAQWGVTFRVSACADGYRWNDDRELVPASDGAALPMRHVEGFEICRYAFRAFVKFGRHVEHGVESDSDEGAWVRDQITILAGYFGPLFGGERPETLFDWLMEGCRFLDLYDAAQLVRARSPREIAHRTCEFDARIARNGAFNDRIEYFSGRVYSPNFPVTVNPDQVQNPITGIPVDLSDQAVRGDTRTRAMNALALNVNRQLWGGLNFEADRFAEGKFTVVPKNLLSMLYLRLWMDAMDAREPDRECAVCGEPIEGNQGKEVCSSACRQKRYRQRSTPAKP